MNILDFPQRKKDHDRIVMVTCYDYTSASILAESDVDMLLVGDSAAMVMHGHDTTLPIDSDDIARLDRLVHEQDHAADEVADDLLQAETDTEANRTAEYRQRAQVDAGALDADDDSQQD